MRNITQCAASLQAVSFAAAGDAQGRAWLAALPSLAEQCYRRWDLEPEDERLQSGYHGLVLPVRRGRERLVLKLTWPTERSVDEARALEAWQGRGAVLLLDADTCLGALLLERLDACRTLQTLALHDAARVAGTLLRALAIPAPDGFRTTQGIAREIADALPGRQAHLGSPAPQHWVTTAREHAQHLAGAAGKSLLVHADLHYGNILAGEREPWLAIDPKPVAGDPEHAVPELLWTRVDEAVDAAAIRRLLQGLVQAGNLDAATAHEWAVVRCMDYWLWGLDHGLTEDPARCRRILAALL